MNPETDGQPTEIDKKTVQAALIDSDIPKIYVNGFASGLSVSDAYVVLQSSGTDVAVLQMSYTTAKTLAQHLMQTIQGLEERTGHLIMTIDDVKEGLSDLLIVNIQSNDEDEQENK